MSDVNQLFVQKTRKKAQHLPMPKEIDVFPFFIGLAAEGLFEPTDFYELKNFYSNSFWTNLKIPLHAGWLNQI